MTSEDRKMEVEENKVAVEKKAEEKDEGPSVLDLAFAMDCTGSMGSYIEQARQNIRTIVEEIVAAEKADVRLALVEYRDHPPQDSTFVTRVKDFTPSVKKMKTWLNACSASGGGDGPEAVADALHQVVKLSWRDEAAKICVFISDAPPHGLSSHSGDGFPNGCPNGLDPMQTANEIGEKGIVMYMVGCEPSITPYRDWFMAIAHITNGQYVPLANSTLLAKVIIGGAQEEIALQRLLEEVNREVQQEAQAQGGGDRIDEEELAHRVHAKFAGRGVQSRQLQMNCMALEGASSYGKNLASYKNMADVKRDMDKNSASSKGSSSRLRRAGRSFEKKKYKTKKSFSIMGMLGLSKSSSEERAAESDDESEEIENSEKECASGFTVAPEKQSYSVLDDDIKIEQSHRLVSRAMKMNKFK